MVAKGFHLTPEIDFFVIFILVVKTPTIRVLLSLAVMFGWDIQQIDGNNAFLNGDLEEEVCMHQLKVLNILNVLMYINSRSLFTVSNKQLGPVITNLKMITAWGFHNAVISFYQENAVNSLIGLGIC